ncbi:MULTISPECIES: hypothetical protein [unclassified Mesorhizobium]|uniref:hypothetical protein n=1 Tax=unclassified Mesorhizobium TaxID=325217 RepID=UPI000FD91C48|nr:MULTISPECIES: hypothetical protein [unclassified Mesorhizobium]TGT64053.1 hypothetical protein EN809_034930 [Mesorhizobium sp. M2E.F.Ca.ET.166.01.1.1]TGV97063.1 hypothetical protein EN797_035230 [Mesorhizobium sp. M2E.F.Ca.ET.154.01.1.1]
MTEWLPEHQSDAQAEGWDIFEASGSISNENGDREFQLQALDDSDIFTGETRDVDAWRHVHAKAQTGSPLHQQALAFLREHSPGEYEAIIKENA